MILYAGSFVALQALDMLLDAVPSVVAAILAAVFLLVGGGDAEIAVLLAQAQRLGISRWVIYENSRPQATILAYLLAADVLVSPRTQGINPPGKLMPYLLREEWWS
jgi:glycosyltransferase involved in cell wall biosynthesis